MIEAIEHVQDYVQGLTLETFRKDQKTIDAVVRNFEIMGEAARHVPIDIQTQYPQVPWSKVRGMRHLLAHEYFGINTDILWKTATQDIAPLLLELKKVL